MNRRQPGVSALDAVGSGVLEMVQERPNERGVEIAEVQERWCFADLLLGEVEQQPEGVSVGSDGMSARLFLGYQPLGEERLEGWCERGHKIGPSLSSRWAANAISSGTAERYQKVFSGRMCPK